MPIFGEIGPLTLDSELEKEIYSSFEEKSVVNIGVKIESVSESLLSGKKKIDCYPCDGVFEIKENRLNIYLDEAEEGKINLFSTVIGSSEYPMISLLKKSNNIFEIFTAENEKIRCITRNNKERDVIALSLRLLAGKSLHEVKETTEKLSGEEEEKNGVIKEEVRTLSLF